MVLVPLLDLQPVGEIVNQLAMGGGPRRFAERRARETVERALQPLAPALGTKIVEACGFDGFRNGIIGRHASPALTQTRKSRECGIGDA